MSQFAALISHNRVALQDMLSLCEQADLSMEFFQEVAGPHVRHLLDHYDSVLRDHGKTQAIVDYDQRQRDTRTELDRQWCAQRLRRVMLALEQLPESSAQTPLQVLCRTAVDEPSVCTPSSLARELQFLHSHTVHHQALIRAGADRAGLQLEADFGKAPATIAHEKSVVGES